MIVVLEIVDTVFFCTILYISSAANTAVDNEVVGLQFLPGNLADLIFDPIARSGPHGQSSCQGCRW